MDNKEKRRILEDKVLAKSIGIASLLGGSIMGIGGTKVIFDSIQKNELIGCMPLFGLLVYGGTALCAYICKEAYTEVENLSKKLRNV